MREILGRSLLKLGRTEQGLEALREFLEFGQAIRPLELDLDALLQLAAGTWKALLREQSFGTLAT